MWPAMDYLQSLVIFLNIEKLIRTSMYNILQGYIPVNNRSSYSMEVYKNQYGSSLTKRLIFFEVSQLIYMYVCRYCLKFERNLGLTWSVYATVLISITNEQSQSYPLET